MGGTPSTEARRAETAEAILEATLELLGEQGYASLTTDAIASRASVSKATIYRHWRTKAEIVVDAVNTRIHSETIPDLGSVQAEVEALLDRRLELYQSPSSFRLVAGLIGASVDDPSLATAVRSWIHGMVEATSRIVERAMARGEIRSDVGVDSVVTFLSAPQVFRMLVEMERPTQELRDDLVRLFMQALTPPTD